MTLELQTDGNYAFLDETGKMVFNFSYLYMYDAEGNDSSDVKMTVIQNDKNEYLVTVTPNSEWLKTAIFPVTIDPTIYSSYIALSFQDTYVSMQYPNTQSYYNYQYFYVANTLSVIRLMNGLLSFSLPNMSGKKMTYSYLTLYKYNSETTQRTIEIHQNTSAFTENTVTWNTAPSYKTDVVDYKVVNGTADTAYIFDISESVREWVDGVSPNYGFTIKDKEDVGALTRFYSSEHWLEAPVVEIGFIDSVGIKDYWTYNSQSAGEAGTGYVSDYTGLMTWVRNDLSYESERGSFGLTMVYNVANRNLNIGYGLGWQTNYNIKVVFDTIVGKYYMLDATGYKNYFYLEGYILSSESDDYPDALTSLIGDNEHGTCYESESGNGQILMVKYNSSNVITGIYVLSTDFTLLCFTYIVGNAYYLQYIKSQLSSDYPYVVTITRETGYPERISLIKDNVDSTSGNGNSISISYSYNRMSSATLHLLDENSLTDTPLNIVTYSYTYLSYMSGYAMDSSSKYHNYNDDVTFSDGQTINYSYDTFARMTNAYENYTDYLNYGNRIFYTYNSTTDQVSSISNYFFTSIFSTLSYSYGLKMTTITDDIGNYIIYKFDDYGHTINLLDSQGTSQSYVYLNIFKEMTDETGVIKHADGSPNFDNNHKLAYSSDPLPTHINPLQNPNFEIAYTSGGVWTFVNGGGGTATDSNISPVPQAGLHSVKISTTASAETYLSQTVVLDVGTYSVSGYIFVDSSFNGDDLDAFISFVPSSEVYGSKEGYTEVRGEWVLVSSYFVVESDDTNVIIRLGNYGIGNVTYDSIQITSGFSTTSGNLVENYSFENSIMNGWESLPSGVTRVQNTYDSGAFSNILGTYGIRMIGDESITKSLSSTGLEYSAFGSTEGNLVVGGWAKSSSAPITTQPYDVYSRCFRIKVTITYASGLPETEVVSYIDFDTSIDGWQYNFISIPYNYEVVNLSLSLEYQGMGMVYFDGIQAYNTSSITHYYYEEQGRILEIIKPSEQTLFEYEENSNNDKYSRIPTIITSNGISTEVESETDVIESIIFNNVYSTYIPNSYGQLTSVNVTDGSINYFTTSTAYLSTAFYQYISSNTDEFGNTTNYYYEIYNGLLKAIENAKYQDIKYIYDDIGNLIEVIATPDYTEEQLPIIDGKVAYLYDSFNRLYKICIDYYSPEIPTFYYEITYDSQNRIEHIKVNTANLMTYTYVDDSYYSANISTETYANLDSIQYLYNEYDQVTDVQFKLSGESAYTTRYRYAYDQNGFINVYTEVDSSNNVIDREFYVYDSSGRISQIQDIDGNIIQYQYDSLGNVASLKFIIDDIENETIFEFDSESKILETSYETLASNFIQKQYDYTDIIALDRLHNISLLVGTTEMYNKSFIYDNYTTRVGSIEYNISGVNSEDFGFSYLYDELGNIIQAAYYLNSQLVELVKYEFDSLNQLIIEDIYYTDSNIRDYTFTYAYDQHGNRIQKSEFDYERNGLDPENYILNYSYESVWDDRLDYYDIYFDDTVYSQNIVSYDAQGNPIEITNFKYTNLNDIEMVYDHVELDWIARTLMSITIYDEYNTIHAVINYTYNANGYRTSKTITEGLNYKQNTYDLLGSNVIHEEIYTVINLVQATQDIYYTYDIDGTLVSFNLDSVDYFYINNIQGDIVAIVNQDGNVVVKYDYDSYGNIIQKSIDSGLENVYKANAYTYRGYRYDLETGLYYLQSRYYNPEIGRFISSDGLLGQQGDILSTNMYAYCANNPVMNIDPSGYLLKTINEYSSDGSGVVDRIQNTFTFMELYLFYMSSDEWKLNTTISLNSFTYYNKLDISLFGLGGYLTIFIKSVPTELSLALIFVDFVGRILDWADTSINYWIAVTFTRKCDGYISRVFYVEIYYNNGLIYPNQVLANPSFGVY